MGFFFRKSFNFGPIRLNLSKSGIGVSTGVKGFRVGTGARGTYVHMGVGGVYYRKNLSTRSTNTVDHTPPPFSPGGGVGHVPLTEVESGDVSGMVHSSSADLLAELNAKKKIVRLGPIAAIISAVIVCIALNQVQPVQLALLLVALSVVTVFAFKRDSRVKTTVLMYDFDPSVEQTFRRLHLLALDLAASASCWHVSASGEVYDKKYHAGASSLVRRHKTTVRVAAPEFLTTNIETVRIDVGRQKLYLFPDRLLIFDSDRVGAVGYEELELKAGAQRFIEDGGVPSDAQVVDHTWRYVNKKGGPDRRFANNSQIPVCLYDEYHFFSRSGLNEIVQSSRTGIAGPFVEAIKDLARLTKQAAESRNGGGVVESPATSSTVTIVVCSVLLVCFTGVLMRWVSRSSFEGTSKALTEIASTAQPKPTPQASNDQLIERSSGIKSEPSLEVQIEKDKPAVREVIQQTEPTLQPTPKFAIRFSGSENDAQQRAIRLYPDLGVAGSPLNQDFVTKYRRYKTERPDFFNDPEWPTALARECMAQRVLKK